MHRKNRLPGSGQILNFMTKAKNRQKVCLAFSLILVSLIVIRPSKSIAERDIEHQSSASAQSSPQQIDMASETKSTNVRVENKDYHAGLYYGHIVAIDSKGDYIFVKPTERSSPRRYFYLDKKSRYTMISEGIRKRKSFADLIEGQRVVVRYFAQGELAVADELLLVSGEFQPASFYQEHRRFGTRKVKSSAASEEPKKE